MRQTHRYRDRELQIEAQTNAKTGVMTDKQPDRDRPSLFGAEAIAEKLKM